MVVEIICTLKVLKKVSRYVDMYASMLHASVRHHAHIMNPPPTITSLQILTVGFLVFAVASVWPPILLVVAVVLAVCLPNIFYEGDHPENRRR